MKFLNAITISLVLFLIPTVAFCKNSPEILKIKKQGVLTVGILHEDTPPFFMTGKDGQLHGFDIELAKRIGKELGVKVEFNRSARTFDDVVDLVVQKKIDLAISKLSINLTRAQKVSYTTPYIFIKSSLLINRVKNTAVEKLNTPELIASLNKPNVSIGIVKGTTHKSIIFEDFPKANVVEFDKIEQALLAVTDGTVDCMQTHETNAKNWLHIHPEKSVRVKYISRNDRISPVAIAVAWERAELVQWLNTLIGVASMDGTLDQLKRHYVESFDWEKR